MDEMASLWSYQESLDELKQKLYYTTVELEAVKAEANEEMKKNTESMKQLVQLLKLVCHERDEARDQLQKLLNKIMPSTNTLNDLASPSPMVQNQFLTDQVHQSPLIKPTKANSSITESNSLSEAYNHSSSPVDSLFDPVSSPEFSNINMDTPFVQDYNHNGMVNNSLTATASVPKSDQASLVIESLIKGKTLPEHGKLVRAVQEAGPLLQNLLWSGPLPKWRNPPPLQTFHIPPVDPLLVQKPEVGISVQLPRLPAAMMNSSQPFVEMSCGNSSQMMIGGGVNVLNFGDVNFSTNGYGRMLAAGSTASSFGQFGKRQRFQ